MPNLDKNFLTDLHDDYTKYPYFIETGTLNGATIFNLEPYFTKLYTIEFSKKYYNNTKSKYKGNKTDFILGDSTNVFPTLLPTIPEKSIFFLDAYWGGKDTGRSTSDCPLNEEIAHINRLFQHDAIIIIPNVRLFGTTTLGDWSQIKKEDLLAIIQPRTKRVYYMDSGYEKNDILIIYIRAK